MWVKASFNLCGFKTAEIDLTPALGIGLIIATMLLIGSNSHWTY